MAAKLNKIKLQMFVHVQIHLPLFTTILHSLKNFNAASLTTISLKFKIHGTHYMNTLRMIYKIYKNMLIKSHGTEQKNKI